MILYYAQNISIWQKNSLITGKSGYIFLKKLWTQLPKVVIIVLEYWITSSWYLSILIMGE